MRKDDARQNMKVIADYKKKKKERRAEDYARRMRGGDILVMTASISSVPSAISTSARVLFAPDICFMCLLREKVECRRVKKEENSDEGGCGTDPTFKDFKSRASKEEFPKVERVVSSPGTGRFLSLTQIIKNGTTTLWPKLKRRIVANPSISLSIDIIAGTCTEANY